MAASLEYSLFRTLQEIRRVTGLPAIAGGSVPPSAEWSAQHIYEAVANWSPGVPDPLELGAAVFDELTVGDILHIGDGGEGVGIDLSDEDNGHGLIHASGPGAEIHIIAADGTTGVTGGGGEIAILSGDGGAGGNGGEIHIKTGSAGSGGASSGQLNIETGAALEEGGDGGPLVIRTAVTGADNDGGNITIQAGTGRHGAGGNIEIQAGGTIDGDYGQITLYEGAFNHGIEIQPTGGIIFAGTKVVAASLPTSAAGLAVGSFWRDAAADNVIKVVPPA